MKTCLLLSGHMRTYKKCFPALNALVIQPLNCDVFIYTWDMLGVQQPHAINDGNAYKISIVSQLNEIKTLYKPINIEMEPYRGTGAKYAPYTDGRSVIDVSNNFYTIYRVDILRQNEEIKTGTKYDVVIKTRPDYMPYVSLPFDLIEHAQHDNKLYLPSFGHGPGLNDHLAFGSPNIMKIYSECYLALDDLVKRIAFDPHVLLKRYIQDTGLELAFFDTDYVLERLGGTKVDPKQWPDHKNMNPTGAIKPPFDKPWH
jgi:hypothetical protein